jgi:hypothetical protein
MRLGHTVLAAAVLGAALITASPAAGQDVTSVPFSDPARPGSVRITSLNGTITVKGANRKDVEIQTHSDDDDSNRGRGRRNDRSSGLRRLAPVGGFSVVEENNQMVISGSANEDVELVVYVPARTNLKLNGVNGGAITVDGVDGDIEVTNINDDIALTNVAGSVVANTTNGDVKVTLTRATPQKPMAFSSFNGDVDVTLPAGIKANLKLRSDMGDVYTDFDVKLTTATSSQSSRQNGQFKIEVNKSITGALNGGGPEVDLHTYNGDVYLRKGAP